jgi:SAM-dependent methyltransferase
MAEESDQSSVPDIATLVDELRRRVDQREREGYYPTELSDQLHEHFRRIVAQRTVPDLDIVRRQLRALEPLGAFSRERIPLVSEVPGGRALHGIVAKLVSRQTQGILEQLQQFSDALRQLLATIITVLEEPHAHVHADLVGQIDALYERVSAFERGPGGPNAAVAALRARVEALEAAEAARRFAPSYENARFEDEFRGTREEMLERYRELAAVFKDLRPVVDIGCGRGEFLELLRDLDIECTGVEVDPVLVEECRRLGLPAEHGDGIAYLATLVDGTLGGIVLVQVIEHLSSQQAVDLVGLAREKLHPGGRVLIETVNPQSLYVFAHAFYVDPTHTTPVHPAYLSFLFEEAGFASVRIEWRSPPPDDDSLHEVPAGDDLGKTLNENVQRLNRLLFAPQDYALIATR